MSEDRENDENEVVREEKDEDVHFIEDLEERKNASGPVTTQAVGEENGGGGW